MPGVVKKQYQQIQETADHIRQSISTDLPQTVIILGSGLGPLADQADDTITIETREIPHWPHSTVQGHRGRLVIGKLSDVPVVMLQGRAHYYEGHSIQQVAFPVRVLAKLGVKQVIITNAAGAFNPDFRPGDLMLITDHINLLGANPLMGPNLDELGTRFPDMSEPYNKQLRQIALEVAEETGIELKQGVLSATTGPSYETAAEVCMLQTMGVDAGCMSTVPEVIAGVHAGLKMLGISCITNMATGLSDQPLSHSEVEETALKVREQFEALVRKILVRLSS